MLIYHITCLRKIVIKIKCTKVCVSPIDITLTNINKVYSNLFVAHVPKHLKSKKNRVHKFYSLFILNNVVSQSKPTNDNLNTYKTMYVKVDNVSKLIFQLRR